MSDTREYRSYQVGVQNIHYGSDVETQTMIDGTERLVAGVTPVNALSFDVDNTGTTDCSASLAAAIEACGNNELYLPPGIYALDAAVSISGVDNITITGYGATIFANDDLQTQAILYFSGCDNIAIKGLTINGMDRSIRGLEFRGCYGVDVEDCEIADMEQSGAVTTYTAGIRVGNNGAVGGGRTRIRGTYIHDISAVNGGVSRGIVFFTYQNTGDVFPRDFIVNDCVIENISPVTDGDGIVTQMTKEDASALDLSVNGTITNNVFRDCWKRGIKIQNNGLVVAGNTISTSRTGAWGGADWSGQAFSGISIYEGNATISNNTIFGESGGAFIYGIDTDGGTRSFYGLTISGNVISADLTPTGESAEPWEQTYGIRVARADAFGTTSGVTVSGNTVCNAKYGYWIGYDVDQVCLVGNTSINTASSSIVVYTPTDTISGLTIKGNRVDGAYSIGPLIEDYDIADSVSGSMVTSTSNDATPTVRAARILVLAANGAPTAITQLDNAVAGQIVTLLANSASNTPTIADSGNFLLSTAWAPGVGDTLTLMTPNGSTWYEISRSDN